MGGDGVSPFVKEMLTTRDLGKPTGGKKHTAAEDVGLLVIDRKASHLRVDGCGP